MLRDLLHGYDGGRLEGTIPWGEASASFSDSPRTARVCRWAFHRKSIVALKRAG